MADTNQPDQPLQPTHADDVEIEPLSDEALEDVAGGTGLTASEPALGGSSDCCSCSGCS